MADLHVRLKYKKSDADDWTKVQDTVLRKKIQDRLAKRKSRARQGEGKIRKNKVTTERLVELPVATTAAKAQREAQGDVVLPSCPISNGAALTSPTPSSASNLDLVNTQIDLFFSTPGLSEHRFLMLTQYTLLRAFIQNAQILAIPACLFADDDALSPWTLSNPYPALAPLDLSPTSMQLCMPHHPYSDLIAPSGFRNNLLVAELEEEVEERLCKELHEESFVIWGAQPWCAMGWEVTQSFATRWAWLLDEEMIRATNFWRGERGESPLLLPEAGGEVLEEVL